MAAGNERNYYDQWEYFSVCDPGGNKNVLTVGSITSLVKDNNGSVLLTDVDGDLELISLKIMEEFFNYNLDDVFQSQELVVNTNLTITNDTNDACLYLGQGYPIIYYGESKLVCEDMEGYVFYTTNESIQQYNIDNKHIYIINERYADQSGEYEAAVYSSLGPAYKGILKPDVAAPGARVVSADSMERSSTQHGCYLNGNTFNVDSGTSMATPNVAGAAALVNQFFKEKKNYYLSGTQLRALMIASASLPDGSKQPNLLMGHGIIDISTILCFDDSFGVEISDNNTYIEHSKHLMTKIKVNNNNSQFRIVMSYLDVELNIESMIPIVHDLDLVVISPYKKRYLGNHRKDDDSEHLSTNEKVIINEDELELGEYEIHIYSNSYVKQSFSIVAVGPIEDNFNLLFDVTQECGCSECTLTGKCKCDSLHIGNHCQKEILEINDFNSKIQIESSSIQRILINFEKIEQISIIRPNSINGSYSSIWLNEECKLSLNDYDAYICLNNINTTIPLDSSNSICIALFNNHFNRQEFQLQVSGNKVDKGETMTTKSSVSSNADGISEIDTSSELNPPEDSDDSKTKEEKYKTALISASTVLAAVVVVLIIVIIIIIVCRKKDDDESSHEDVSNTEEI